YTIVCDVVPLLVLLFCLFSFSAPATTEIYTLSLHDALPIWAGPRSLVTTEGISVDFFSSGYLDISVHRVRLPYLWKRNQPRFPQDRKSTRLNSSHVKISYAVFCLKKKKNTQYDQSMYR